MKKLRIAGWVGLVLVTTVAGMAVQAQDGFSLNAAFGVRAIRLFAEKSITALIESMHVMTATANLKSGDWEQMKDLVAQFEQSELSYNAWFLKPDGSYYKVGTGLATSSLSDRDYFTRVMAGETTLGDLVVSRSTGRKSMVLTAPIYNGSSVIGALGVTLYLDDFSALLVDRFRLPGELGFYAYRSTDPVISIHENPELLLESVSSAGIELAAGGIDISSFLGWTFLLGTIK
ncbi:hypothetical protein KKG90_12285 [Candidatus Bipolaricaulota bacterium]|nr:hypothetical protein [Candidatus Bipolaricaulota bacterium]